MGLRIGNLPAEPNDFIGRERDLAELAAMVGQVRVLTLCGHGGIGKTRLALRLAARVAEQFAHGAWVVDLAEAGSAERTVPLIMAALEIREEPGRDAYSTLVDALRPLQILLVLDTCEHLVPAFPAFISTLIRECPSLCVVVTSRQPLKVSFETTWRVPPLALPPPTSGQPSIDAQASGSESVRLFMARARAVRPGFTLDSATTAAVTRICRALDGVPLAIELAAARVRSLSAEQIAVRISHRLDLLALGDRTAPPRQRSLRATVAWSYDLLTEPEQLLLRHLSAFRGWTLEMVLISCADLPLACAEVSGLLTALIDKSLVIRGSAANNEPRYRMLDTVREFAIDQANARGEWEASQRAQRDTILELAVCLTDGLRDLDAPPWPAHVRLFSWAVGERANFQLALDCCAIQGDARQGLELCCALRPVWLISRETSYGVHWLDTFLAASDSADPGLRARALVVRAELAFEQHEDAEVERFAHTAARLSDQPGVDGNPAGAQRMLAALALRAGRASEAVALAASSAATARQTANLLEERLALVTRARALSSLGDLTVAQEAFAQILDEHPNADGWTMAGVQFGLGRIASARGDFPAALRHFCHALANYQQIGARPEMAQCLSGIGTVQLATGDLAAARGHLAHSLRLCLDPNRRPAIARILTGFAELASLTGDDKLSARLTGAALMITRTAGTPAAEGPRSTGRLSRLTAQARQRLGTAAADDLLSQGQSLDIHEAVTLALAQAEPPRTVPMPSLCPVPQAEPWPGPLSPREREVALLVADGLSNQAIGRKLFISPRTAARHVANIFAKLGFSSRSHVVAWVVTSTRATTREAADTVDEDPASDL